MCIRDRDNVALSDADTKGMFIDILPELPPDDGTAKVSFYVEDLSNLEKDVYKRQPYDTLMLHVRLNAAYSLKFYSNY